ncbi:hypothetical protein [Cohnella yongneupensis]|uniref:Uncharacterized protein n=1 Tax=Cohnella yongneupensis TaxID=425006 RepID=A0ABW0QUH7_9BACL
MRKIMNSSWKWQYAQNREQLMDVEISMEISVTGSPYPLRKWLDCWNNVME